VHWHVIGVPEGVTLLEFEPNPEEQPPEQEVQAPEEAAEGDVVDYLDHMPCNVMKGKPRSIISFVISEDPIKYYVIYIVALSDRCWMKTLAAYVPYPCPESIP
jgi:hypothetical protein